MYAYYNLTRIQGPHSYISTQIVYVFKDLAITYVLDEYATATLQVQDRASQGGLDITSLVLTVTRHEVWIVPHQL